jgi:hypothetical protein
LVAELRRIMTNPDQPSRARAVAHNVP